ncbi:MAG: Crp/Fnr family transcriptional regulator [Bacteroidia bacterium]
MEINSSPTAESPRTKAAMPRAPLKTKITCLSKAPQALSHAIVDQIIEMEREVFTDASPEKTKATLLGQNGDEAWVMTMQSGGKVVGYSSIRIAHYQVGGRMVACWKSRAGVHPDFRGQNSTAQFPGILYWRYRLRFPFRKIYGMIGLMHPSSFKLFADGMPRMYPFPKEELTARETSVFEALCQQGGYQRVHGYEAFVLQGASFTNMGPLEARYWNNSNHPAVRYFLGKNPDFGKGRGLLTFFPIDLRLMWDMVAKRIGIGAALKRIWLRLHPRARQQQHVAMLQHIVGQDQLPAAAVHKIAREIWEVTIHPHQELITHGHPQQSIYFLVQGSLLVHLPTTQGMHTVDQLAPGAIVGEIGAILGIPATATVQAVGKCKLLQMGPGTIALLRSEAPALMEHLHRLISERIQMNDQIFAENA